MERKWRVLAVVCVAVFMLLLDITVVNVALPDIQKELNTSFADLQWVVDAYALTLAATMLNAGSLGDLLGRKRVFLVAIALFTAASALCGAAQSPTWLILARGAQGIGGAGMFAVSLAIISQEFHGRERGTAFGIWGATVGLAVAIGPLVGGALTTYVGWRWIFFVNIPIGVAVVAGGVYELHETRDEEHGGFDLPGLLTLTAGLFALVLGLFRGNDWGWSSGRIIGLFAAAAALLVAFVLLELRRPAPMADLRLFKVPTFTGAQITAFAISSAMFAQFLFIPLYIENVLGYSAVATGVRFLPLSLVSFVVAPIAGRLSERMPVRFLLGGGLALSGVALMLMWGVQLESDWTTLLPGFLVAGVGIGFVNAPLASTAVSVVEPRRAGMASGINNTFRQIGIATGIAALGAIFQSQIAAYLDPSHSLVAGPAVNGLARTIASGATPKSMPCGENVRGGCNVLRVSANRMDIAHSAFIHGLNTIFVVAAFVLFVGAILAFVLVRQRDFVASGPAAEAAAG
jgi:EmrB/QacA subfamily drug resistance transporter